MKKFLAMLLALALTGALTACAAPGGSSSGDGSPAGMGGTGDAGEQDPARAAFRAALETIYSEYTLPNGDALAMSELSDITNGRFAVMDIDRDGEEELIFTFADTYMAGMLTYVYAYDGELDRLLVELVEFPTLSFYDTGIVEALASHNQGPAGDALWPFILYQYEPVADDYRAVATVDAWDKSLTDFFDQQPFPDQADTDGDGVVYYIMHYGDAQEEPVPVDGAQFWEWYASWFQGAQQIDIPYRSLTWENIQSVG